MLDQDFFPRRVQVPVGTRLPGRTRGAVIHTATDTKGAWNTGDVPAGQSASITFDTPGTYTYAGSPHPWMLAQIIIQ